MQTFAQTPQGSKAATTSAGDIFGGDVQIGGGATMEATGGPTAPSELSPITVTNNAVFAPYALYLVLALGYFVSCFAITRVVRWFDPKYQLLE